MDNASARAEEQTPGPETPEDVAILYSWANLPGAKYRDFSASRREYRAQQRARVAEAQRQTELQAARELEDAAQREIENAQRQLEETRQAEAKAAADAAQAAADAEAQRRAEEAQRRAEEVMRRAEAQAGRERQEALRRQQSAEELRIRAERAQEEMLEARKRAEEQAARYAEADLQSAAQMRDQARVLPGETSDPYYYTGPVDPAYFASTPGVRTAQAARVSTERKAYVYPMHPGSDEYDSGTVVTYRGENQFAPSPAHQDEHLYLEETATAASQRSAEQERDRVTHESGPEEDYAPDDDYYDGGRATRLFAPSPRGRYTEGLETASAELHIRPASRVSGDHEQPARTVRPSPMTQVAFAHGSERLALSPAQASVPLPTSVASEPRLGEPRPVFRASEPGLQRSLPQAESLSIQHTSGASPFLDPYEAVGTGEAVRPRPIRYEEVEEGADERASSRMFIPSPRRRVLHMEPVTPAVPETAAAEPTLTEVRDRDAAAAEGKRKAQAEVETRAAQDRFVHEQESETAGTESGTAEPKVGALSGVAMEAEQPEPAHWRSLNRSGESGLRRRRQPGREPIARTARRPRGSEEPEANVEAQAATEPAAPPAWLSAERAVARPGEDGRVELAAVRSDLPAAPGDPGVPAPRPVLRRQPSGLRPRVPTPAASTMQPERAGDSPIVPPAVKPVSEPVPAQEEPTPAGANMTANDTLQQSRERVASRWFALSGLMGSDGRQSAEPRGGARSQTHPAPVLCVLSISGGVGKTSIVATLGRALSSVGEKVLLADTSVHGMLPYYFGAREQRPGVVRTFSPPPGSSDAPVVLVGYDADGRSYDEAAQAQVLDDLYRRSNEVQRVLVDAGVNSAWLARTVAGTNPWVLVPVAPDMNSVLGTHAVERLFQDVKGADGRPVKPFYVLNQYDPAMPLHLDVREVLRQFLGDRLLPIMLHRTPAVSEALAEGMTVIDYAPRAPITNDYMNLATWVRHLADPGLSYVRPARWSER